MSEANREGKRGGGGGGKEAKLKEKEKKEEEDEEKEADEGEWWGCLLYSLVHFIGGGKATLKVRGDVVVAGTRRVFVPAGRK